MTKRTKIKYSLITFGILLLVYSCANMAQGPTGGPKDVTPPSVLRSFPANNSLNFKKKLIQIDFDELVSVEKASDNVIISPPQVKAPDVKSYGKRVSVVFDGDLVDSTTYTINFGNAIVDLTEKNPIKNYVFSFSTGNEIDTLKISGTVLNAEDLNPMPGIYVGIYRETDDSVFFKKPFLRIAKTDENGRFSIDNIKKGKYKIYALGDANHDYFYQPGEGLALYDSLLTPYTRREEMTDTIWKDSITVDSIHRYMGTHFLPDDVTLSYFKEAKKREYFLKAERKTPYMFSLFFNTAATELPILKPLNFKWDGKFILQKNATMDSLSYWLTDSVVWKTDTLQMAMTYLKSDSVFNLVPQTDTLNISMRKLRIKPSKKPVHVKVEPYNLTTNISPTFEIYNPIALKFETPLAELDLSKIKLSLKVDTILKTIPFKWRQVDSTRMNYAIDYKWIPEKSYKLEIDSAVFKSIYNKVSNKFSGDFTIRSLDEYSSVKMYMSVFNPKAVMQVLDTKDQVLATRRASQNGTVFEYLKPGDYYVRMFIDENGNGKWDTGDLSAKRHPEEVYYYPNKMTLMANWEFEETWDYKAVPLLKQKPAELIKDVSKKDGKSTKKDKDGNTSNKNKTGIR